MSEQYDLRQENAALRRRLAEAEDTIHALKSGEIDAVVGGGEKVYTLEAPDQSYRVLVEQMPHAAAAVTGEGRIIHCNRRFAALLDQPAHALCGKVFGDFVCAESRERLERMLRDCANEEVQEDVALRRNGGEPFTLHLGVSPLQEGAYGACRVIVDQTERKRYEDLQRAQAALRAAGERLELAQRAGSIGTFEWNARTGAMSWSAAAEDLYGLPAGGLGDCFESWQHMVHPDDVSRAAAGFRGALAAGTDLDTEFRIVRPDGQTRWIETKGKVFRGQDGRTARILGVSLDVTERRRTEEALREADRRKDEFLATLAHELRNPLAPIRNAVEILKVEGPGADMQWSLGVLDRQVQQMSRLLDDLLDVSRISRNMLELRTERVDLRSVLELALETSRPAFEAGRHQLEVDLPPEPLPLVADPARLAQVFANLLNNAAKYTDEGGRARLSAERHGCDVIVSVKDSGIGISAEMLPRLFQIFSQAEPALVRAQGGLGIGLSLVKGLVELHGGSIEAESAGPGRGSEFRVRLPLAGDASDPEPKPALSSAQPETHATRSRILIVDDNHDSADSLALLLKVMGNDVDTAYDGEQAVQVAEKRHPDVVLLDLGMPRMNGYEACRRIRRHDWGRGICMIAVTGWGQEEDRHRTEEAGFDHHMVKPVDPATLMRLVGREG